MSNPQRILLVILIAILVLLGVVGLTWANYQYAMQFPGGEDFLPRWLGTRLFMTTGASPYSEATTREIQTELYGRLARPGEDQGWFLYPFYSVLIVAPFALISDFTQARALWMTVMELALIWMSVLGWRLADWRVKPWLAVPIIVFGCTWYHAASVILRGDLAGLVALLIVLALLAIRRGQDSMAGFLLALSTIKPNMVILVLIGIFIWAYSQRRHAIYIVFIGSLALLVAVFLLFQVDWLLFNLIQVVEYASVMQPGTPGAVIAQSLPGVGVQIGWGFTILMGTILIVEWRSAYHQPFLWFLWVAYLSLAATNLVGIPTGADNYLALYPALFLVFAAWEERWARGGLLLTILSLVSLFAGLWAIAGLPGQSRQALAARNALFFAVPLLMVVLLYWVRWWATNPPRLVIERLRTYLNRRI